MADRALVTSVEAIEAFRANVILYLSKARPAVEEVSAELLRTRLWLQNDKYAFWQNQLRHRSRDLERAQNELFDAMLSKLQNVTAARQMAVTRAKRAVAEAEAKLALLKHWDRELENRSEPLLRQVDQLHGFLTHDMSKAVAYLSDVIKSLEAYADVPRPGGEASGSPAADAAKPPAAAGAGPPEPGASPAKKEPS